MSLRARRYSTGDQELDALIERHMGELSGPDREIAMEIVMTALKLAKEQVSRLDRKLVNGSLKEMRHAFRVFAPYKGIRKVSIFGSARTKHDDVEYDIARRFSKEIARRGWMVITGAGPGIMEAGHEGAGGDMSFGANILLPFEAKPNPVIAEDEKLINFKYFFTRKVTFMKEADAFVLLPGGFGTLDETLELLTLVQTGKSDLHPIVLLDVPGSTYWQSFHRYIEQELLSRRFVDEDDTSLYRIVYDPIDAVEEIQRFYRVYHSQRMVGERLVLRLKAAPDDETLDVLSEEFADIMEGRIERVRVSRAEMRDQDVPHLPRIGFKFDRQHAGRLRQLIDRLNEVAPESGEASDKGHPAQV